nr:MAG TPA: hypothetical protein [Caudoviricetes sp.]
MAINSIKNRLYSRYYKLTTMFTIFITSKSKSGLL